MWLIGTVDWNAVSAIAAVLTVIGTMFWGAIRLLRTTPPARLRSRREQTAEAYLTKLKQSAKAVNDAADGRTSLKNAQALFTALGEQEEELRRAFGHESAVHWVARLNRGMLGRGIDITNGKADSSYAVSELMEFGVDRTGFEVFERERDAAMKQKKPVKGFATEPEYLTTMADMAQLRPPYREQFEALLVAHHQPLRETGK